MLNTNNGEKLLDSAYQASGSGNESFISLFDPSDGINLWTSLFPGRQERILSTSNGALYLIGTGANANFPYTNPGGTAYYDSIGTGTITRFDGSLQVAWATGFGATSSMATQLNGICEGAGNSIYVVGQSANDTNLPLIYSGTDYHSTYSGTNDGIILQFGSMNQLLYSTYIGGTHQDAFYDVVAVNTDAGNKVYITGFSNSSDFPCINSVSASFYYTTNQSTGQNSDGVFIDMGGNLSGHQMRYSTYLGGSGRDNAFDMDIDDQDRVYLTGRTLGSSDFPVVSLTDYYFNNSHESEDAFIARYNGEDFDWITYFGGYDSDQALGLAIDSRNYLYVVGATASSQSPTYNIEPFPVVNFPGSYFQPQLAQFYEQEAFVARFALNPALVGIDDFSNSNNLYLYPNPANQRLYLEGKFDLKGCTVSIFNTMGQVVYVGKIVNEEINIAGLQSGLYIIYMQDTSNIYKAKFVKQ